MFGDKGDFEAMKQDSQRRRSNNLNNSTEILKENEVAHRSSNNGIHLFIFKGEFDFYPSTGLFMSRKTGKKGRGIFNLIKFVKQINSK